MGDDKEYTNEEWEAAALAAGISDLGWMAERAPHKQLR